MFQPCLKRHKYRLTILAVHLSCCAFPVLHSWSTEPFRIWTDRQDRSINARIVGLDNDTAYLQKAEDDTVYEVPLKRLSTKDRKYIKNFILPHPHETPQREMLTRDEAVSQIVKHLETHGAVSKTTFPDGTVKYNVGLLSKGLVVHGIINEARVIVNVNRPTLDSTQAAQGVSNETWHVKITDVVSLVSGSDIEGTAFSRIKVPEGATAYLVSVQLANISSVTQAYTSVDFRLQDTNGNIYAPTGSGPVAPWTRIQLADWVAEAPPFKPGSEKPRYHRFCIMFGIPTNTEATSFSFMGLPFIELPEHPRRLQTISR